MMDGNGEQKLEICVRILRNKGGTVGVRLLRLLVGEAKKRNCSDEIIEEAVQIQVVAMVNKSRFGRV